MQNAQMFSTFEMCMLDGLGARAHLTAGERASWFLCWSDVSGDPFPGFRTEIDINSIE